MNIVKQKEVSNLVLTCIKKYIDNEAIIAGGAPRNWVMGNLANDIDLYMRSFCNTSGKVKAQIGGILSGLGEVEWVQEVDVHLYKFGINLPIQNILAFKLDGVLFQIIVCQGNHHYEDFKMDIVNHMDIGLNRVYADWYYQYEGAVLKTDEFKDDLENKTLTLFVDSMTESQLKHCMTKHLPKMISYFPDYKLEIKTGA